MTNAFLSTNQLIEFLRYREKFVIKIHLSSNPESSILGAFITGPQAPWITASNAFSNEFFGAALLSIIILALGDDAFLGAFLYDFLVFTGGESPVNYPLERTERALRKAFWLGKKRLRLA